MTTQTTQADKTFSGLKYYGGGNPATVIDILNSNFEQTEKQYNSFCQRINDRLSIQNDLQLRHEPISPTFNRKTRLQLITNVRNLNSAFNCLSVLLNQSSFKKVNEGLIIPYDFNVWMDVGIKLTKAQINDYIKQIAAILEELHAFTVKYRLNK